jgi:hypothetical protein
MLRIAKYIATVLAVLSIALVLKADLPVVATGNWSDAGRMSATRAGATSVLLPDGRVMIVGGTDGDGEPLASVELFNTDGTFTPGPAMNQARTGHAAIALLSGEVLVTGGTTSGGGVTNSAEAFDPLQNAWRTLPAPMVDARSGHAMAQLKDGNILIAGGGNSGTPVSSLEIFSLISEEFKFVGSAVTPRKDAAVAMLPDGRALIAGGTGLIEGAAAPLASTEIFTYDADQVAGTVATGPNMTMARTGAIAVPTYDGVAIVGGSNGTDDLGTAEIYSQWKNVFRTVLGGTPRNKGLAILLPNNGSILITGGSAGTQTDLLQPWRDNTAGAFLGTASPSKDHTGGLLSPIGATGLMVAAGGQGQSGSSAELYRFPTIATDQEDYAPGTTVVMTGTGWSPNETVALHMHQWANQSVVDYPEYTVTADSSGSFVFSGYAPTEADLNTRYHLTAVGQGSGLQAQTVFTDAQPQSVALTPASVSIPVGSTTAAYTAIVGVGGNSNNCTMTLSVPTGLPTGASAAFSGGSSITANADFSKTLTITITTNGPQSGRTPAGSSTFTVQVTRAANCQGNGTVTNTGTLIVQAATTLSAASASGTYGGTATLSATLSPAVSGKSISFTLNGATVGSATTSASGVATLSNASLAGINAGNYANGVVASFAGDAAFASSSGNASLTVAKATPLVSWSNPASITYGTALGATQLNATANVPGTFTYTPAAGTVLSAGPRTLSVDFAPTDTANYNSVNGTTVSLTVNKATPTVAVSFAASPITYDGNTHAATATVTGINSTALSVLADGTVAISYKKGGVAFAGTPTDAAGYTASAHFTSSNTNYNDANSTVDATLTINRADATITVTPYTVIYDGNAHTATGTAKGVKSEDLSGLVLTGTTHTNAGDYTTDAWTFTDVTGNYNNTSGTVHDHIDKADATIVVTPYSLTYDENAHTATGTAKGVKNEDLSGLVLTGTTHTNAGDYTTDAWTFTDVTGNYNNTSGTVHDHIDKAEATIVVNGYTGVYDGDAHGATGTAKGVKGEDLGSLLNLGASFMNVPGGAANWTFAGDTNYKSNGGTAAIVITQADASIAVNGYTGVYDGNAHGATGSATGVKGESLSSLLHLGASFTNVPGGTADWTFDGNTNYRVANGTEAIVITQADASITVNGYTGVYDGDARGASGTATGVKGESLVTLLHLGASFTNVPGGTADWTFDGNTNYKAANGTVAIVITQADASITVNGYTGVYDGNAHGASGTATGVQGESLSSLLHLGASFTDAPGGTADWAFDGNTNYKTANGTASIVISKADATIAVTPYNVIYDGHSHLSTGLVTGAKGEPLNGLDLNATAHTDADDYAADGWTFTDVTGNYNNASGTTHNHIDRATATINVNGFNGVYDGSSHGGTGSATGVSGEVLSALLNLGETFTNVPGGTAHWIFDGNANYNGASGDVSIAISKAPSTTAVTFESGPFVYRASAFTATAHVSGVGLSLDPTVVYTGDCLNVSTTNGCTATATFNGDGNHEGSVDSKSITIEKATSTTTVTFEAGPYVYRGSAFMATAQTIGVGGLSQSITPTYSGDCVNVTIESGCTATANFAGDGNHHSSADTNSITITRATPTVHVSNVSAIYDGHPHGTTATVTGVGSVDLGAATIAYTPGGPNAPVNAGPYAVLASFAGNSNYNPASANATVTIDKATPVITWPNPANVIYGTALSATQLNATANVPGTFAYTPAAGTVLSVGSQTLNVVFSPTETTNYNTQSKSVTFSVLAWTITGFYQPITPYAGATVIWNTIKGGSTVPVKFNIYAGTVQRTDVGAVVGQSITLYSVNCATPGVDDAIDYVVNTGSTALRYDSTGGQFIQNWQTPKLANQCYLVRMAAQDGSKLEAYFKTK